MIKRLLLVLETATIVYRIPIDRQRLVLHKAESFTACIMSFVAKCSAETKEDKLSTVRTVLTYR